MSMRQSLAKAFTGKFVYMAYHFIWLQLNPFSLTVDRDGCWFDHSLSELLVCLAAEAAKNVSWPWIFPLRGWGNVTMEFTAKFVYMTHHFILLIFNPFGLRVDIDRWCFELSESQLQVCQSFEGAKTGPGYLRAEDVLVGLWHLLANL